MASLNWAEIAADTDYYDQSHLIAEFKRLTGMTPAAFTRQRIVFSNSTYGGNYG
jgi:AraC-like DNA-binding protein